MQSVVADHHAIYRELAQNHRLLADLHSQSFLDRFNAAGEMRDGTRPANPRHELGHGIIRHPLHGLIEKPQIFHDFEVYFFELSIPNPNIKVCMTFDLGELAYLDI
jgi:hypothetical protein